MLKLVLWFCYNSIRIWCRLEFWGCLEFQLGNKFKIRVVGSLSRNDSGDYGGGVSFLKLQWWCVYQNFDNFVYDDLEVVELGTAEVVLREGSRRGGGEGREYFSNVWFEVSSAASAKLNNGLKGQKGNLNISRVVVSVAVPMTVVAMRCRLRSDGMEV